MPTTEKYYEPEEEKLRLVVNWFIQKWSDKSLLAADAIDSSPKSTMDYRCGF
jgi:hypothetical protein